MSEPTTERTHLTANDAARELGIGRRTLNRYGQLGLITITHHAGQAYVSRAAISDYWARRDRAADQRRAAAEKRRRGR